MKPWHRLADIGERCTCCNKLVEGHAVRMLEMDQRTNTYSDLEDVPADSSQGWFPFGLKCAKKMRAKHSALTSTKGGT